MGRDIRALTYHLANTKCPACKQKGTAKILRTKHLQKDGFEFDDRELECKECHWKWHATGERLEYWKDVKEEDKFTATINLDTNKNYADFATFQRNLAILTQGWEKSKQEIIGQGPLEEVTL